MTTPSEPAPRYAVGLMSGTSADGIDAAVVRIAGAGLQMRAELVRHVEFPFDPAVRAAVRRAADPATGTVDHICRLNFDLGERFAAAAAAAISAAGLTAADIAVIGSHGQTIHHVPPTAGAPGSTLQIGEPSIIAERTGATVVADFRPRDMAVGGQGAPLVPFADYVLFGGGAATRVIQNIGGIANLTWLASGGRIEEVVAFDTGPGNGLIDAAVRKFGGGPDGCGYDRGGAIAASGKVLPACLARWKQDEYFRRRPPKSTGLEMFGARRLERMITDDAELAARPADLIATLTQFTAETIAEAYVEFLPSCPMIDEVILCGGGAKNPVLTAALERLVRAKVRTIDELGMPSAAKEALSFALLALATIDGVPNNVPAVTGASRAVVLGKICPADAPLTPNHPSLRPG